MTPPLTEHDDVSIGARNHNDRVAHVHRVGALGQVHRLHGRIRPRVPILETAMQAYKSHARWTCGMQGRSTTGFGYEFQRTSRHIVY